MFTARAMAEIYDSNRQITSYVHSPSKGHEAIQLATAYHLKEIDWVAPYYRDESILLGIGMSPYQLMLLAELEPLKLSSLDNGMGVA